ncbi:MAG: SDR family oxidoreductase [Bacteroidetes bacterium]|nr:SDR family oxidoreductase [Bacteroidota bacterium]
MQKSNPKKQIRKAQHQNRPGKEFKMKPQPVYDVKKVKGSGKLTGKIALITGGDSGIGRAVATLFAKEGADIAIVYLNEHKDADETKQAVEEYGQKCLLISTDISKEKNCIIAVSKTFKFFKHIDIVINNAAIHYESKGLNDISTEHLLKTFQTNIFSFFWITKSALPHLKKGGSIINTSSVTAYRGSGGLIDYASTKGAIISFTRSLSANLVDKGIRVNAVAPGPIWTPLIVSSFKADKVSKFGSEVPMKRAGEPAEVATCYLFLASDDSSYITGQVLHPNGGEIVNS